MLTQGNIALKKNNTVMYGYKSFQVQGSLILNRLKDDQLYCQASSKYTFLNKLKKSLLNKYTNSN